MRYVWIALLVACTAAAAPPAKAPPVSVTIGALGPTSAMGTPQASATCTLETQSWGAQASAKLRFGVNHDPFLIVHQGQVRLTLGLVTGLIPTRAESRGVVITGTMRAADTGVFATKPLFFGEIVVPRGSTPLRWTGRNEDDRMVVAYRYDADDGSPSLRRAVSCSDLSLEPGNFDPLALLGGGSSATPGFLLSSRMSVAASATGPVIAILEVDEEDEPVDVIEHSGDRVRVVWEREHDVVRGWVDKRLVAASKTSESLGELFDVGGMGLSGIGGVSYWTCPRKLDLHAKQGDTVRRVGHIKAHVKVSMGVVNDGYRDVRIEYTHRAFEPGKDVVFLVPESALGACRVQ